MAAQEPDDAFLSRVSVTFHIDGHTSLATRNGVLVASRIGDDHVALDLTDSNSRAACSLPAGEYVAAVHSDGIGLGAVRGFIVDDEPVSVDLVAPYVFDLEFPVLDVDSSVPIPLAILNASRMDLSRDWHQPAVVTATSDSAGFVRLEGMTPGEWQLAGTAPGYAASEVVLEFPGNQEAGARREGLVTLTAFHLPALRTVQFQLVNHEEWDDLTEFSVAHTNTGKPVPFSASGIASLQLGWYSEPLYIKIDYPGKRSSIRYIDGGLPEPGGVHEIDIGSAQDLEVDLHVTREMLEALEGKSIHLAVSYRAPNKDATKTGVDVDGPTTIVFGGIRAKNVVVSLETTDSFFPMDWKSARVAMKPTGRTSCTLNVDSPPIEIHVIDESGQSTPGFHCEIRQIPDDTSWASGGISDELGILRVGRVLQSQCTLFGVLEHESLFAIDVPIDLASPGPVVEFSTSPNSATYVEILSASGRVEDVPVEFVGVTTPYVFHADWTDANGRTKEIQLVTRSRAKVRLELETRWTPTPEFDLQPGRNAVTVYDTGQLRVTASSRLGQIRSLDFDTTLADWVTAHRITVDTTDGGALLCRVPVGAYEVTDASSEPRRLDVRAGAVTPTGI